MSDMLQMTPSPHIKADHSTTSIMANVIIALIPAVIGSVLIFGFRALLLVTVCVVSCVFFEYIYRKLMKRTNTVSDLSAVVTGILLAFNLPANFPVWMAIFGSAVAIIAVKQLFGGIGDNFANPAIVARIVLFLSFTRQMATWPIANSYITSVAKPVSGATPLSFLKTGSVDEIKLINLLTGIRNGCLGETFAVALIVGGVYLMIKKVITPTIPLSIIVSVGVMALLTGTNPLYHIFSGGVILGAFFMATDYSSSPITEWGKLIYGVLIGVVTMLIRVYGAYPEGMSFAILLMNIVTPLIDKATIKKAFGGIKR